MEKAKHWDSVLVTERGMGFPKEERGKETVLDKVGGQSDETLFQEKWLISNQPCHQS